MSSMTLSTTGIALSGCYTALITPFRDGQIDEPALRALVHRQVAAGVSGLVPCGTTGEAPALSAPEWERVIALVVETAGGRVPVIAGTGSNDTTTAIERTRTARTLGADSALVVTPYYNRPTQEGLYRHFAAIAEAVDLPIVLYNVPGRTGVNLLPETAVRLADFPGIVGIKEASGSLDQASQIVREANERFRRSFWRRLAHIADYRYRGYGDYLRRFQHRSRGGLCAHLRLLGGRFRERVAPCIWRSSISAGRCSWRRTRRR